MWLIPGTTHHQTLYTSQNTTQIKPVCGQLLWKICRQTTFQPPAQLTHWTLPRHHWLEQKDIHGVIPVMRPYQLYCWPIHAKLCQRRTTKTITWTNYMPVWFTIPMYRTQVHPPQSTTNKARYRRHHDMEGTQTSPKTMWHLILLCTLN